MNKRAYNQGNCTLTPVKDVCIVLKKFDKSKAVPGCNKSLLGTSYVHGMEGYLSELCWNFLKKGMKVCPHRHPKKEAYIFIRGKGSMQVGREEMAVEEGDIVFVPSNALHTAWNVDEEDLEFIIIGVTHPGFLMKLVKMLTK